MSFVIGASTDQHFLPLFLVFVLSIVVGYYVVWGVAAALHTPLMALTNAISGIIVLGMCVLACVRAFARVNVYRIDVVNPISQVSSF